MQMQIHDMVIKDRTSKLNSSIVAISKERAFNIVIQQLGMKKLSARWVTRLLYSQECLGRFQSKQWTVIRRQKKALITTSSEK